MLHWVPAMGALSRRWWLSQVLAGIPGNSHTDILATMKTYNHILSCFGFTKAEPAGRIVFIQIICFHPESSRSNSSRQPAREPVATEPWPEGSLGSVATSAASTSVVSIPLWAGWCRPATSLWCVSSHWVEATPSRLLSFQLLFTNLVHTQDGLFYNNAPMEACYLISIDCVHASCRGIRLCLLLVCFAGVGVCLS